MLFGRGKEEKENLGRLKIFISPPLSLSTFLFIVAEGFFGAKKSRLPLISKKNKKEFDFPSILQYFNTLTHIFFKSTYPIQRGSAPAEAEAKDAVTLDDLETEEKKINSVFSRQFEVCAFLNCLHKVPPERLVEEDVEDHVDGGVDHQKDVAGKELFFVFF